MKKKRGPFGLMLSCVITVVSLGVFLYTGALFIETSAKEQESQSRIELFDPWQEDDLEDSYQGLWVRAISQEFAADLGDEFFYYVVYDQDYEIRIVRMKEEQFEDMEPLFEFMYGDLTMEAPEPMLIYGTAVAMDEEIVEYAVEAFDYMFGEGMITAENFASYAGHCYLDITRGPHGDVDFETIRDMLLTSAFWAAVGLFFTFRGLFVRIREEELD